MRRFQNATLFWQVERRGATLLITTGKRRTGGRSEALELASAADAANEYERLVAQKKSDRWMEVKVGPSASDGGAVVAGLLDDLRKLGEHVATTPRAPSAAAVAAAEQELGFALPSEYLASLARFGRIVVGRERSIFFYDLSGALAKTKEYAIELAIWRASASDDAYYPSRFLVLSDRGEHSNVASGLVYDDTLKAIVTTDGGHPVDRTTDVRQVDYFTFLAAELKDRRDELDLPSS